MKLLGKITFLFILLFTASFASVVARVEPSSVYRGDTATYIITIKGEDIVKPLVTDICGNDIISTASQTSIEMTNFQSSKKTLTLSYQFVPTQTCTIEEVSVQVDSSIESSNSVSVKVKDTKSDTNPDFILLLSSSKKELYVGEPFELTLLLKQKRNAQVLDSKFIAPEFQGLWIKEESQPQRFDDGTFITTKVVYTLAAQRSGNLSITPAKIQIATRAGRNNWGTLIPQVKWRTYASNIVDLAVKALPQDVKLIGDFTLTAEVNKTEINPNDALDVHIKVTGNGNLEDIENFKPYLENVNIFDEKITISGDTLSQKLVFVSEKDFIIPAFTLKYFNKKSQKVEILKTQEIAIHVRGNNKPTEVKIQRDEPLEINIPQRNSVVEETNYFNIALAFLVGLLLGIGIMSIRQRKKSLKNKSIDIKDEKMLLVKLLPFKDDSEVETIIDILENNIYSNEKVEIDKKLIKELLKRYDIT